MPYKPTKKVTYRQHDGREPIPAIIIEGKFLRKLGFEYGDTVEMTYEKRRITITKASNQHDYALQSTSDSQPPNPFPVNHRAIAFKRLEKHAGSQYALCELWGADKYAEPCLLQLSG